MKCELGLRPSDARGRTAPILRFPYWACVACVEACVSRGFSPPPEPSSGVVHTDANLQQRHKSFPRFVLPLYKNFHQFFMQCHLLHREVSVHHALVQTHIFLLAFSFLSPDAFAIFPWARIIRGSKSQSAPSLSLYKNASFNQVDQ
jgi:hypothetical protein